MHTLHVGKYIVRIKRIYKENYPLFLFILLSGILIYGLTIIEKSIHIAASLALLLSITSIFYYYSYFSKFKSLTDTYSRHRQYYYDIYSVWGVFFFNCLFLCVFAYNGVILASYYPDIGFGDITFIELLKFLIQTVIDGISLGLLGSYAVAISNVELNSIFAKTYMYVTKLIIDLAFIASVFSVIGRSIKSKRMVRKVADSGLLDREYFSTPTPDKVKEIIQSTKSGQIKIGQQDSQLVFMLRKSSSKEARDIIMQIFQCTNNLDVFSSCAEYFQKNKDRRFMKVCRKITDQDKIEIIESKGIFKANKK